MPNSVNSARAHRDDGSYLAGTDYEIAVLLPGAALATCPPRDAGIPNSFVKMVPSACWVAGCSQPKAAS